MSEQRTPRIVALVREGAALSDLQAAAGKLWLDHGGAASDEGGVMASTIEAYWRAKPGRDPYWDFLGERASCDACGESYKYENLAICPNCFRATCHRHDRRCRCGHDTLG